MSSENPLSGIELRRPFEEVDTKEFKHLLIFKMEANKILSKQQIEKIRNLENFHWRSHCPFIIVKDSEYMYLCLSGIVSLGSEREHMWEDIVGRNHIGYEFSGDPRVADGGHLCISEEGESYVSHEFLPGAPDMISRESAIVRHDLQEMIGIDCYT